MVTLKMELQSIIHAYNDVLNKLCTQIWGQEIKKEKILELFWVPRKTFIDFCKENHLNYSSVAGIILEWSLFHLIKTGAKLYSRKKGIEVINRYSLPFKWKNGKYQKKRTNIDVVVKDKNSTKLYYAFEVKTNFEDGFEKYRREEKEIFHHRQKVFRSFRYFYISLNPPSRRFMEKHKRDINILQNRGELYILNENTEGFLGPVDLIKCLKESFTEIK